MTASSVLLGDLQTSMPRMKALVGLLSMQRRSRSMGRCEVLFIIVLLITWGHNVACSQYPVGPKCLWYFPFAKLAVLSVLLWVVRWSCCCWRKELIL